MSKSKVEWEQYLTDMLFADEGETSVFDFFDALMTRCASKVAELNSDDFTDIDPYRRYDDGSFSDIIASASALLDVIYYNGLRHGRFIESYVSNDRRSKFNENYLFVSRFISDTREKSRAKGKKKIDELIRDVEVTIDRDAKAKQYRKFAKKLDVF